MCVRKFHPILSNVPSADLRIFREAPTPSAPVGEPHGAESGEPAAVIRAGPLPLSTHSFSSTLSKGNGFRGQHLARCRQYGIPRMRARAMMGLTQGRNRISNSRRLAREASVRLVTWCTGAYSTRPPVTPRTRDDFTGVDGDALSGLPCAASRFRMLPQCLQPQRRIERALRLVLVGRLDANS